MSKKEINLMDRKLVYIPLGLLELYIAWSALKGGFGLMQNGMGLPVSMLSGTPFHSFFLPGLILFVVIGGTNLVAATLTLLREKFVLEATAVAGFGLMIWDFTEIYMLKHTSPLQILFFGFGVLMVLSTMVCLRLAGRD